MSCTGRTKTQVDFWKLCIQFSDVRSRQHADLLRLQCIPYYSPNNQSPRQLAKYGFCTLPWESRHRYTISLCVFHRFTAANQHVVERAQSRQNTTKKTSKLSSNSNIDFDNSMFSRSTRGPWTWGFFLLPSGIGPASSILGLGSTPSTMYGLALILDSVLVKAKRRYLGLRLVYHQPRANDEFLDITFQVANFVPFGSYLYFQVFWKAENQRCS